MFAKLPPETEAEIQRLVDSGEYDDPTDVLVQGVHLLVSERERAKRLHDALQISIDQYARGDYCEFSQDVLDERWELALEQFKTESQRNTRAS
jgi:Arc/MetJ-type ribon-helix-helix transcriptional regulator